ncbi:ferrous iron transport protein B [Neglectibacter timonensis]|uniref:ferrous iron transport protein B n=1 Tax=Neglectibacter timonensis TaxID=1776382 RepID=UPI0008368175|nr:ferrous iron transport protein B [Neglectibacter timonensis]
MAHELSIGFVGNPNCGKTTLFNAYTGANLKVANWPGVTVEKKEGRFQYHDHEYKLVDLPGTYSLTSYTMEEQVSRQYILSDDVDVIIDVADASALERNLYLTLQLIELGKPVILALNMMDIVEKRGMEIDTHRLPEMLGIPVIPVSARRKTGLDILMHAASHHKDHREDMPLIHHHHSSAGIPERGRSQTAQTRHSHHHHHHHHHQEYTMVYSDEIENKIDQLLEVLRDKYPSLRNPRWYAIKLLESDKEVLKQCPIDRPDILDRSYEQEIINQKYDFIDEIIQEVLVNKEKKEVFTDKIDNVLTNTWLGLPIFLGIMALVFFLTFTVGDWLKGFFEMGLDLFSGAVLSSLQAINTAPMLISLIVDGIITGVGGILTFLPNIFILFLALAFLEDSGYMSRVAYVMDGIMGKLGLSGRSFIPMILGFGCSVPAIMASRALENKRDRYKTMLITPFMSCSARLPIYVLFSEMFFPEKALLVAYSMYLLGLVVAVLSAFFMHLLDRKKTRENSLLIELPEYKAPSARTIAIYVWEKVKDYLTKAGTVIFIASILMWFLLNFGPSGYSADMSQTYGSLLGKWIVPFFAPIGLGYWQIVVALIAGISAKEVVVSSCAVLFGISNITSNAGMSAFMGTLSSIGFGALNAYALMTFSLLYIPCAATLATIKKETGSWGWTGLTALFQIAVAWVVTFLVYHIGLLIV